MFSPTSGSEGDDVRSRLGGFGSFFFALIFRSQDFLKLPLSTLSLLYPIIID